MAGQLLPPPEQAPSVPKEATTEQCVRMWMDLNDTCHELLLAGFRQRLGPTGDVAAAYREWEEQRREEHAQAMIHMMQESVRRGKKSCPRP